MQFSGISGSCDVASALVSLDYPNFLLASDRGTATQVTQSLLTAQPRPGVTPPLPSPAAVGTALSRLQLHTVDELLIFALCEANRLCAALEGAGLQRQQVTLLLELLSQSRVAAVASPHAALDPSRLLSTTSAVESLHGDRCNASCSLGCRGLDRALYGGIPAGAVTEIVGESGSGKTQIVLQALLHSIAAAPHVHAIYLVSEDVPDQRISQIAKVLLGGGSESEGPATLLMERLLIRTVRTLPDLLAALETCDEFCGVHEVRIVAVDSVTEAFFTDAEQRGMAGLPSTAQLFMLSQSLRELASRRRIAVLVTNQVRSKFGFATVPALGIRWAYCVHVRILLQLSEAPITGKKTRTLKVLFCPYLPQLSVPFEITAAGVSLTPDS